MPNKSDLRRKILNSAKSDPQIARSAVLILHSILYDFGSRCGAEIFPGDECLARKSGCSLSTVRRQLKKLENAGYIRTCSSQGRGKKRWIELVVQKNSQVDKISYLEKLSRRTAKVISLECSYSKEYNQTLNQERSLRAVFPVDRGSDNVSEWDEWLIQRGLPLLSTLGVPAENGSLLVPMSRPPTSREDELHILRWAQTRWANIKEKSNSGGTD